MLPMALAAAQFAPPRSSGELGVYAMRRHLGLWCSDLIDGLYDARLDHMLVLATVGQQSRCHWRSLPA